MRHRARRRRIPRGAPLAGPTRINERRLFGVPHARQIVDAWRVDYNANRPHSSLGNVPPTEFEQCTLDRAAKPILTS